MRRVRRAAVTAALLCFGIAPASAQESGLPPWRWSYFPYLVASPNDGVLFLARAIRFRQADYYDRVSLRDAIAVEGGYSTRSAALGRVRVDLPLLADGWRLAGEASIERSRHFGDPAQDQERTRELAMVDVTRRIRGRLQFATQLGVAHEVDRLDVIQAGFRYPGVPFEWPCLGNPPGGSACDRSELGETDFRVRGALVLDLRDREYDVRQGALVELGGFIGSGGDGYQGAYGMASGYISPWGGGTITARAGFRALTETTALGIRSVLPTWERETITLGGSGSLRALPTGADPGRGLLMAGLEVRQDLLNLAEAGNIAVLAFVDGGRSFNDPPTCPVCVRPFVGPLGGSGALRLTLEDWTWGFGGGIALRVLRSAQLTVTAARARHETRWFVSSGWSW